MPHPQLMGPTVADTDIIGLKVIGLKQVSDERGTIREFYRQSSWQAAGLPDLGPWLQLNVTETRYGAIRGLHGEAMTKLVGIVAGSAFGAYVDLRTESPSFGNVVTVELVPGIQVLVPQGVGNGFQCTSDVSQYLYSFDAEWVVGMAGTSINPFSPALGITWPISADSGNPANVSNKDASAPDFQRKR